IPFSAIPFATPATSRYWTSAWTLRCGLNISVSRSRRGSGTLTVARFGSSAAEEKPPVGASDRVSALNTVVLPDEGKPRITSFVVTARTFHGHSGTRHRAGRSIIGQIRRYRLIGARNRAYAPAGHLDQLVRGDVEQVVFSPCAAVDRFLVEHGDIDNHRHVDSADADRRYAAGRISGHVEDKRGIGQLEGSSANRFGQPPPVDSSSAVGDRDHRLAVAGGENDGLDDLLDRAAYRFSGERNCGHWDAGSDNFGVDPEALERSLDPGAPGQIRVDHAYRARRLGSRASRRPSPKKFSAITTLTIARPGN